MSTSQFGYLVSTDTSVCCAANHPLDALSARIVMNNVNHLSDEFAQVRVNWNDAVGIVPKTYTNFTNQQIGAWQFPITQRQNGDSYKFRIRLAGAVASGTATLMAVIGPPGFTGPRTAWGGAIGDQMFVTASLGAGIAWVTGTSQGPAASGDLIYLPAAAITSRTFTTAVSLGGNPAGVDVPFAQLSIYGTASAAIPTLNGVYLAEYVGT